MYLYCPKCGEYQGSLGAEHCNACDSDNSNETKENLDEASTVLYCGKCNNYLGSLGGKVCDCCGWTVLDE